MRWAVSARHDGSEYLTSPFLQNEFPGVVTVGVWRDERAAASAARARDGYNGDAWHRAVPTPYAGPG